MKKNGLLWSYFFEGLSKKGLYLAFNKNSSVQLVEKFKGAFLKLKRSGKYTELSNNFFK